LCWSQTLANPLRPERSALGVSQPLHTSASGTVREEDSRCGLQKPAGPLLGYPFVLIEVSFLVASWLLFKDTVRLRLTATNDNNPKSLGIMLQGYYSY